MLRKLFMVFNGHMSGRFYATTLLPEDASIKLTISKHIRGNVLAQEIIRQSKKESK
jgi:hypothetical protein